MLDTTHGYEATLRAESVARRKRLNVGRVPKPIIENPARPEQSFGKPALEMQLAGAGTCGATIEWVSAQDAIPDAPRDIIRFRRDPVVTISRAAAKHYGLDYWNMISARKHGILPQARQVAMYLSIKHTRRSWADIGHRMGGRDRTTILHGYKRVARLINTDPQLAADVAAVRALAVAADPGLGQ